MKVVAEFLSSWYEGVWYFWKRWPPVWDVQPQVTASPVVSGKPAPEAWWVSLWTVYRRCTLEPVNRVTQERKHHPCQQCISNKVRRCALTDLRSIVAVTNTINFPLLVKHGLPGGRRQSESGFATKDGMKWKLLFRNLIIFCVATRNTYLQTNRLCDFLHQAVVDGAVSSFLPGDGTTQCQSQAPDVFPQEPWLVYLRRGWLS